MERRTSLVNAALSKKGQNSTGITFNRSISSEHEDYNQDVNNNYDNHYGGRNNSISQGVITDNVDYLEEYTSSIDVRLKRLKGFLENLKLQKETCKHEINVAKSKINKAADEIHLIVDQDRAKLLGETDMYYENTEHELDRLQLELMASIKATEEFANFVQELKESCSPEQQAGHLIELRNRQRQLDSVKHDVAVGSLKFVCNDVVKSNIIGKVNINDTDTSDPYTDQPIEIGLIEGNQMVSGVTMLNGRIYIIRESLPNVEVYVAADLSRYKMLKLEGLRKPSDIAGDTVSGHVYISDAVGYIYKLQPDENILTKLPIDVSGEPQGICIVPAEASNAGNLLVTCYDSRQLKEFTPSGQLIKSIRFQQDVLSPWHVVPLLSSGWLGGGDGKVVKKYALCHGWEGGKLHRVCWIDENGRTLKSHGASNGSGAAKLDVPSRMAVDVFGYLFVADRNNDRVVLLSPNLVYVRDIVSRSCGARQPRRIYLDPVNGHLFVGLVDGSVRVFQLLEHSDTVVQ